MTLFEAIVWGMLAGPIIAGAIILFTEKHHKMTEEELLKWINS